MKQQETEKEMISRLKEMADPLSKWDLSDNDRMALRFVLDELHYGKFTVDFRAAAMYKTALEEIANFNVSSEWEPEEAIGYLQTVAQDALASGD